MDVVWCSVPVYSGAHLCVCAVRTGNVGVWAVLEVVLCTLPGRARAWRAHDPGSEHRGP